IAPPADGKLPAFLAGSAICPADWLMMALNHKQNPWKVSVIQPDLQKTPEADRARVHTATADENLIRRIESRIAYCYPHIAQTLVPTKLAVSEAAKGERAMQHRFSARPRFIAGHSGSLTPAERGLAMHKFMQFSDWNNALDDLHGEIGRMRDQAFLSAAEIESLSPAKLRAFFKSGLAARIFKSEKVMRELRFMSEFGQDKLHGILENMDENCRVTVQGVADCVFTESGGNGKYAVIVDYKTDRVKDMQELLERYRTQLELYREILCESLDVPVKECVLYSFELSAFTNIAK
ncbi:MAG: PD-(D/E)XK nuclease family protein, partial [Oscillospiraceae bacterium]|nr:PD-(D/E)XK nuclease family protein [Oscillospiraceae bacterium]